MNSFAKGPDSPVLELTLWDALRQTASRFPRHEALIVTHQGIRLTWDELQRAVEVASGALQESGLVPGDRVGMWATACAQWIILQFACAAAGVVLVNVNPAYRSHELSYVLKKSRMRMLFLHERDDRADYCAVLQEARHKAPDHELREEIYLHDWESFIARSKVLTPVAPAVDDVVNMQFTSGTTGMPKGVLLTHRNLVNNGRFIGANLRATHLDRLLVPVPMFHCFGCVMGTMTSVATGAAMILPSAQFAAAAGLEAIQKERPTAIYGVPTMFISWLNHPDFRKYDMGSLRTGIMAGAPCPIAIMRRVVDEMHCSEMTIAYGQTESSPVITMSQVTDSLEVRCTSVGAPLPATEVKLVNEVGEVVPAGETGELLTRGYLVMKGYDDEPAATRQAIDDEGWLHTGDLAAMLPDGNFKITGRAKDTIIRGGENVYPREVEEFLLQHPKIAEVCVVGLPDAKLGEIVAAWVKGKPGVELSPVEILDFCRGQVAYFKIPQHIRIVDGFPMTASGKMQRYRIRASEIEALGLEHAAEVPTA